MLESTQPLESYLNRGNEKNPNLLVLKHRQGQLTQLRNANIGNFVPNAFLFARYEAYKKDLTLLEPEWAAGVGIRFNLFNGGSDFHDTQAVGRDLVALEYVTDHAHELVKTEIRKYHHDLNTAKEQYQSLETSRALAEENLRLNRLSFKEGVATALEVIDAQLALGKVKVEQSKALYEFDVALAQLLRASGGARDIVDIKN